VRRCSEELLGYPRRQTTADGRRSEERPSRGEPAERALEDGNPQAAIEQAADRERGQGMLLVEVSPQEDAGRPYPCLLQYRLQ
jgi:hypothetical protein